MDGDYSELGNTLAGLNIHVLTAGVVLQAALMALVLYSGIASRAGSPAILVATHAFEAVLLPLDGFHTAQQPRARAATLDVRDADARAAGGVRGG